MAFVASLSAAHAGDSTVIVNEGGWTEVYDIARIKVQDNQIFFYNKTDAELEVGITDIAPKLRVRRGLFISPQKTEKERLRGSKKFVLRFVTKEGNIIRVTLSIEVKVATELGCYFFYIVFSAYPSILTLQQKTKTIMRYTTLALCLFLFGNSWAQRTTIVHNKAHIAVGTIEFACYNDGVTIYNCDSNSIFLEVRDSKKSYPISFSYLPTKSSKRLYSQRGKKLRVHVVYNMGYGKGFVVQFKFKRPPRKHRVVFFYHSFLSISASLSAIYCLKAALLKKYT